LGGVVVNWRVWVSETAKNSPGVTGIVAEEDIFQSMSVEEIPDKDHRPFLVLVFENDNPSLGGNVSQQRFTAWCHDVPGSYLLIDEVLANLREAFVGQVSEDKAFCCEWQGDSGDLEDPAMKTIVRTSSYLVTTRH
jgi:hypothetical protein